MAILAPLFFNFGLLICLSLLALFSLSPISLLRLHSSRLLAKDVSTVFASGWGCSLILIVLPAIAGYQLGVDKVRPVGPLFSIQMLKARKSWENSFSWVLLVILRSFRSCRMPHKAFSLRKKRAVDKVGVSPMKTSIIMSCIRRLMLNLLPS